MCGRAQSAAQDRHKVPESHVLYQARRPTCDGMEDVLTSRVVVRLRFRWGSISMRRWYSTAAARDLPERTRARVG